MSHCVALGRQLFTFAENENRSKLLRIIATGRFNCGKIWQQQTRTRKHIAIFTFNQRPSFQFSTSSLPFETTSDPAISPVRSTFLIHHRRSGAAYRKTTSGVPLENYNCGSEPVLGRVILLLALCSFRFFKSSYCGETGGKRLTMRHKSRTDRTKTRHRCDPETFAAFDKNFEL